MLAGDGRRAGWRRVGWRRGDAGVVAAFGPRAESQVVGAGDASLALNRGEQVSWLSAPILAVVAPPSGWLADRFGARLLSSAGLGLSAVALRLSQLTAQAHHADLLLRLLLLGIGIGTFNSPNPAAVCGAGRVRGDQLAPARLAAFGD